MTTTTPQATEAELVDVLMGRADPEVAERVRRRAAADADFARELEEWRAVVDLVRSDARPALTAAKNVRRRTMKRVRRDMSTRTFTPKLRGRVRDDDWEDDNEWDARTLFGNPLFARGRWVYGLAVAALAAVALVGAYVVYQKEAAKNIATVLHVQGRVVAVGDLGRETPLKVGDALPLPARLHTGAGGQAQFQVGERVALDVYPETWLRVENRRRVFHEWGRARYRIASPAGAGKGGKGGGTGGASGFGSSVGGNPFTVETNLGRIVDIGTDFTVERQSEDNATARVREGAIRILPEHGPPLDLKKGQSGTFNKSGAQYLIEAGE